MEENNITAAPDEKGLYVIVEKRGNGAKVAVGKQVKINYTGRLLDGEVFDTNIETIAQESGVYTAGRTYEPMTYTVGQMSLIEGWERGVMGQPAGSKLKLVMPSSLAYGAQGAGADILPYTPLTFEIEIVDVK